MQSAHLKMQTADWSTSSNWAKMTPSSHASFILPLSTQLLLRTNTHKKMSHFLFLSFSSFHSHSQTCKRSKNTHTLHALVQPSMHTHSLTHSHTHTHSHTRTLVLFIIFCHFNLSTSLLPITETLEDVSLLQLEIIWDTKKRKRSVSTLRTKKSLK